MHRSCALALLVFSLGAASASAATVSGKVTPFNEDGERFGAVRFTAAPGEQNRVRVRMRGRRAIIFHDAASALTVKGQCVAVDRHTARCPTTDSKRFPVVRLGDGDDRATVTMDAFEGPVLGGEGDDTLAARGPYAAFFSGGPGDDVLRGAGGRDELTGGPGSDVVSGGPKSDRLVDGESEANAARDTYVGESRADTVDYELRSAPLTIDLAQGTTSTGDTFTDIKSVSGGSGADRLTGDAGANTLVGGRGDDVISGGDGHDALYGSQGDDMIAGDDGEDTIGGEPGDDVLGGGAGDDRMDGGLGDDAVGGEDGDDDLIGAEGVDLLVGGAGDDRLESLEEKYTPTPIAADHLVCGDGADRIFSDDKDIAETDCDRHVLKYSDSLTMPTIPVFGQ
ncbi:MAG: hypothetical protein QOI80_2021, partial [Solirubrobacteraceae bacterium]|nr:hypothetical protein [Solirubrobacteraceae bacterium]